MQVRVDSLMQAYHLLDKGILERRPVGLWLSDSAHGVEGVTDAARALLRQRLPFQALPEGLFDLVATRFEVNVEGVSSRRLMNRVQEWLNGAEEGEADHHLEGFDENDARSHGSLFYVG